MIRDIPRARFANVCPFCQRPIAPGDAISFERSPRAKHFACSPAGAPIVAPPAPVSRWQPYEGKVMTVEDAYGNRMSGKIVHQRVAAFSVRPAIDRWAIELPSFYRARHGSRQYYRELRDSDRLVGEYVLS